MMKCEIREQKDGTWSFRHLGCQKVFFPTLSQALALIKKQIESATKNGERCEVKVIPK